MFEDGVAQDFVDHLPIASNQTLFVEIYEVAFYLFCRGRWWLTTLKVVPDLIALYLLKRVAKSLQFLEFAFPEQLLDDLRKKVNVPVLIL